MEDKQIFQQVAQKLIDHDAAMSSAWWDDDYYVEYCPKWWPMHRIFLVFIALVNLLFWTLGHVHPRDNGLNALFLLIWCSLYAYYRTQVIKKKEVLQKRTELLQNNERQNYIEILDTLAARNPQWGIEPWWKEITGMELKGYDMNYYAFPLEQTDENNEKYLVDEGSYNKICGKKIKELLETGGYQRFVIHDLSYNDVEEYRIAALCIHDVRETSKTFTMKKYETYEELNQQMDSYKDKLDRKEARHNFWDGSGFYETNAEKHERRSWSTYARFDIDEAFDDRFEREMKERRHRKELEEATEDITVADGYLHDFCQVGWVILNNDGFLIEILAHKGKSYISRFHTYSENTGCPIKKQFKGVEADISFYEIISRIGSLCLEDMDYTEKRPPELTLKEWSAWIYSHWSRQDKYNE